jgi:hypothetical protein
MAIGFESVKDVLDVLLVPFSVALIAVLWPSLGARRRRVNFVRLIRRELEEAAPYPKEPDVNKAWHEHLTRRFLHEEIIGHPSDNVDFVLSLKPGLSYNLSQMWIAYDKAAQEAQAGKGPSRQHATQFCWYLKQTISLLGWRHKSTLITKVQEPWVRVIEAKYPGSCGPPDADAPSASATARGGE